MAENVYQHFRKEEHTFIDNVLDWIQTCETQYTPYLTDFLDPRQVYIVTTLLGKDRDLKLLGFGGYELAERKRLFIYPDYYEPKLEDFDIELVEIQYPQKFTTLTHSKILGTLMSTGVKREFFGDIITDGYKWQFFVSKNMENYIKLQLEKIGNVSIRLESRVFDDLLEPINDWEDGVDTVASLRLDAVISTVFKISRQRAKLLIESGKVKVNWAEATRADNELALLDTVSVRGFGRLFIQSLEGKTKKDKLRISFRILYS